jgi:Ca2+-binding EF-hand superfamily protein
MSSISGISSSLMSSMLQDMQSRPDPSQKFKELDTDSSGGLDKTELSTMAKELSKMTGKTFNVDDAIKTYDTNNDGQLSQNEMGTMMKKTMGSATSDGSSMQQVLEAYQKNSGDDQMSALLKMLDQSSSSSATSGTSTSGSSNDTMSILLNMLNKSARSGSTSSSRPNQDEMFKKLDSDGSGGLNQSELDAMAKNISSMTGQTIDTKNAISTYDANGDGQLDKTEMDTMMKATMEKSSGSQQSSDANQADATNNDQLSLLRQLLDQYSTNFSADSYKNLTSYI